MNKAKAVCVMRTDLRNSDGHKVPKGKLVAQGSHAFVGLVTNYLFLHKDNDGYHIEDSGCDKVLFEWLTGIFTKVVLGISSEEKLLEIYNMANKAKLNTVLITDAGHTEFDKPTITCIGIGPDWEEKIDKITGHLKGFS